MLVPSWLSHLVSLVILIPTLFIHIRGQAKSPEKLGAKIGTGMVGRK